MGTLTVINDTHCGVVRSGGTTPKTAWSLRLWVLERFRMLVEGVSNSDLLILGDLLDAYSIPYNDLLSVLVILSAWTRKNPDSTLYLVPGNHDLSKTTTTMSSFQFLCRVLGELDNVVIVDKPGHILSHNAYVIPHVVNQEQFDIEIAKVQDFEPGSIDVLLLHCNYDNKFAQRSDHSLNLDASKAVLLPVKHIVFAHEHQRKVALKGKVQIIGNQIPSSVADCIGNDEKVMLEIHDGGNLVFSPVWEAKDAFVRIDWHDTAKIAPDHGQFIRVEGDAAASEANAVVSAISKLRSTHSAFVITNAVKIEGRSGELDVRTLEKAQAFDVKEAVLKRLSPEQRAVVVGLLDEHGET